MRISLPEQFTKEKPGPSTDATESIFIPAKPATRYRFSAWGKIAGRDSHVFLRELDKNGSIIAPPESMDWLYHSLQWKEGQNDWVRKELEFVTQPNCAKFQVSMGIRGWGTFWVDDLELVEAGAAGANLIQNGGFEEEGKDCYRWETPSYGLRAKVAQAILNSLPETPQGERILGDVDKYTYWCWRDHLNLDPDLPQPNRATTARDEAYELLTRSQADGVHLDSMQTGWVPYHNCRQSHLECADIPLTFDPATGRPALLGALSACEFVKWIADDLHKKGKLLHMNIESDSRYYVGYADLYGGEVGSWGRPANRKLHEVESDARANAKRTLAYQKAVSNLLQEGNYKTGDEGVPALTHEQVEQYIKHQLFYGIWPGISTIGGSEKRDYLHWKRYFSSPEFYERDRDLFKKYIPILRRITQAGWEPVTYAVTSDPKVFIERFGYWEKGSLCFTIRNSTPAENKVTVSVDLAKLAKPIPAIDSLVAEEVISGNALPLRRSERQGSVEFDLSLGSFDTRVVVVKAR